MSLPYIRETYKVNYKVGSVVSYNGKTGSVVGAVDGLLKVRFWEGGKKVHRYIHPTDPGLKSISVS